MGISKLKANSLAVVLSPNIFKVFSLGPINLILALLTDAAKAEFSLRKPYPGWMKSTLESLAIEMICLISR